MNAITSYIRNAWHDFSHRFFPPPSHRTDFIRLVERKQRSNGFGDYVDFTTAEFEELIQQGYSWWDICGVPDHSVAPINFNFIDQAVTVQLAFGNEGTAHFQKFIECLRYGIGIRSDRNPRNLLPVFRMFIPILVQDQAPIDWIFSSNTVVPLFLEAYDRMKNDTVEFNMPGRIRPPPGVSAREFWSIVTRSAREIKISALSDEDFAHLHDALFAPDCAVRDLQIDYAPIFTSEALLHILEHSQIRDFVFYFGNETNYPEIFTDDHVQCICRNPHADGLYMDTPLTIENAVKLIKDTQLTRLRCCRVVDEEYGHLERKSAINLIANAMRSNYHMRYMHIKDFYRESDWDSMVKPRLEENYTLHNAKFHSIKKSAKADNFLSLCMVALKNHSELKDNPDFVFAMLQHGAKAFGQNGWYGEAATKYQVGYIYRRTKRKIVECIQYVGSMSQRPSQKRKTKH